MKNKLVLGIFCFLILMTSSVFGSMAENSRQGFEPKTNNSHPVSALGEPGLLLGFTVNFLNFRVGIGIITKDPIGFSGGRNLWGYAKNNPVRFLDPTGLVTTDEALGNKCVEYKKLVINLIFHAFSSMNPVDFGFYSANLAFLKQENSDWGIESSKLASSYDSIEVGHNRTWSPGWNNDTRQIFQQFGKTDTSETFYSNVIVSNKAYLWNGFIGHSGAESSIRNEAVVNAGEAGSYTDVVVLHETGHLLGILMHSFNANSIMYNSQNNVDPSQKILTPWDQKNFLMGLQKH